MKRTVTTAPEIKVVGRSGQISLGKRYAGKTLRLQRFKDGRIVLTAMALVPETQLWTLTEPHRSRIERGLAWAAKTAPEESVIDRLLNQRPKRSGFGPRKSRATGVRTQDVRRPRARRS